MNKNITEDVVQDFVEDYKTFYWIDYDDVEWEAKWKSKIGCWKFKTEFGQSWFCEQWGNDEGERIYKEKKLKLNFPIVGYFKGCEAVKLIYTIQDGEINVLYGCDLYSIKSSYTKKDIKRNIKDGIFIVTSSGEHIEE